MRKEYELTGGRPNPYVQRMGSSGRAAVLERFLRSEHFVRLDDDLAEAFKDDAAVNATLRLALQMRDFTAKPKRVKAKKAV